jgi:two-component system response regulator FixJ
MYSASAIAKVDEVYCPTARRLPASNRYQPHFSQGMQTCKEMGRDKIEIWVIDSVARRRSFVTSRLSEMGYPALPLDPSDRLPETLGRAVIAMINDDTDVVDRVLDCRDKQQISCVVYSDSLKAKRAAELVRRGVTELMDWPCEQQDIAEAVSTAQACLSVQAPEGPRVASARDRVDALSSREREVLGGVMSGKTSRQIAETLNLSHRTVEVHRINCFRRLGVNTTSEAVRLGKASGCFKYSVEI